MEKVEKNNGYKVAGDRVKIKIGSRTGTDGYGLRGVGNRCLVTNRQGRHFSTNNQHVQQTNKQH